MSGAAIAQADAGGQGESAHLPPLRGRPEKGTGYVATLVRATSLPCTPLLAGGLLRAILVIADYEHRP